MTKKSPITLDQFRFYAYRTDEIDKLDRIRFDERRDFLIGPEFCGIAVRFEISNHQKNRGVNRTLSFSVYDMTSECEVAHVSQKITIKKGERHICGTVCLPYEKVRYKCNHRYDITITDESTSQVLGFREFRLLDGDMLPHPKEWFDAYEGGIRIEDEEFDLKKALTARQAERTNYVRFNLETMLDVKPSIGMPQLELNLHFPDGKQVYTCFATPLPYDMGKVENPHYVEFEFSIPAGNHGVFYAELLCMKHPIAGFVFQTGLTHYISGRWTGYVLIPMECYTPEYAAMRFKNLMAKDPMRRVFENLLDDFISGN